MDMGYALKLVLLATGFTFFMTALGAATVFFFKGEVKEGLQKIFLGFAAGVMVAASVWSLLNPAIEMAEASGMIGWIPAAGGFSLGALFLFVLDSILPHQHPGSDCPEGLHCQLGKSSLLFFAILLHNIPEGMAVGLTFVLAAQNREAGMAAAIALAIGMGIQNFPEGAAISLPLKNQGMSRTKAFLFGAVSAVVEPLGGVLTVLIAGAAQVMMPWLLSFAAGAMIYVVVEELIPEAHLGDHSNNGTMGVLFGFLLMMVLDVALG